MRYVMCGMLEGNLELITTKSNKEFGIITLLLSNNIKSNFFNKSLLSIKEVKLVIQKQLFLSDYAARLIRGTTVLVEGDLIKFPYLETGNKELPLEDLRKIKAECVLFLGEKSKIHILSLPREKEIESLEFYRSSFSKFKSAPTTH